jgi:TolA-binding protein
MATGNDKDQELRKYLSGELPLSESYRRQGAETPPLSVDNTILAAARREAKSRPRPAIGPFGSHWLVPASVAAVLVIATGLAMVLEDETGMAPLAPEPVLEMEYSRPAGQDATKQESPFRMVTPGVKERREREVQGIRSIRLEESTEAIPTAPAPSTQTAPAKKAVRQSDRLLPAENEVPSTATDAEPTTEQWLTQIKDLIKQGRQDEANKLIERFKTRYPDYPIDKELELNK